MTLRHNGHVIDDKNHARYEKKCLKESKRLFFTLPKGLKFKINTILISNSLSLQYLQHSNLVAL